MQHRATYEMCKAFLLGEGLSSTNWEIRSGNFDAEPTKLESAKYKLPRENPNIHCVRGRLRFPNVRPQQVLELIVNVQNRPAWDSQLEVGEVKMTYGLSDKSATMQNVHIDIASLKYKGQPPLVSARDLCIIRFSEDISSMDGNADEKNHCLTLFAQSIEHPSVPVDPNYVRAQLYECGYMMKLGEEADGKFYTDVTYVSSLDFKGHFPASFTNIILSQQPATLVAMRSLLAKSTGSAVSADNNDSKKDCILM